MRWASSEVAVAEFGLGAGVEETKLDGRGAVGGVEGFGELFRAAQEAAAFAMAGGDEPVAGGFRVRECLLDRILREIIGLHEFVQACSRKLIVNCINGKPELAQECVVVDARVVVRVAGEPHVSRGEVGGSGLGFAEGECDVSVGSGEFFAAGGGAAKLSDGFAWVDVAVGIGFEGFGPVVDVGASGVVPIFGGVAGAFGDGAEVGTHEVDESDRGERGLLREAGFDLIVGFQVAAEEFELGLVVGFDLVGQDRA